MARVNVNGVRETIKDWLQSVIHIDEFSLDGPDKINSPVGGKKRKCHCTFYPVEDLTYGVLSLNQIEGNATYKFSLKYRYSFSKKFDSLDVEKFELLAEVLNVRALVELNGEGPIKNVESFETEFPVQLYKEEDEQSDWAIEVNISLRITYTVQDLNLDDEFRLPDDPETQIDSLNIKTYNAGIELDTGNARLDMDYTLIRPEVSNG